MLIDLRTPTQPREKIHCTTTQIRKGQAAHITCLITLDFRVQFTTQVPERFLIF